MQYQCVKCKKTWGSGILESENDYSHGLCLHCLKEALLFIYRKRQAKEGNWDCFGTAYKYCDQCGCLYRQICLEVE